MEKFEKKIKNYIDRYHMLREVSHLVIGVSGGADSVCLLVILNKLAEAYGIAISVVHINHMIRGAEADEDEAYVEGLCQKLSVPLKSFHIDVCDIAKKDKLTVEEAGRIARYKTFNEVCAGLNRSGEKGRTVIAVAHNKNDVAETVLFHMARGTGIDGVKGIPPVRDNIIRPLLCVGRYEIEAYLKECGIEYCIDSTNNGTDYTRNKIRHIVLPALMDINERSVEHIAGLAQKAGQYSEYVNSQVDRFSDENVRYMKSGGNEVWSVPIDSLEKEAPLIQDLVIKKMTGYVCGGQKDIGENHVGEVRKLYNSVSGSLIMLPHGACVRRSYGTLDFESAGTDDDKTDCIGTLQICIYDRPEKPDLSKKEYTKLIDYDKIRNDVILRNYRENDYMVIAADASKKKINRLFSSYKIPVGERKNIPLVADGSEIIWVVGYRLSERYKVDENTKKIMEIKYKKNGS